MRSLLALLLLPLLLTSLSAQAAESDDAALRSRVGAFIDTWHDDAAHARAAYFDKMAPEAVYIGTDRHELWQREAFRAWAKPYFDTGKAWAFKAIQRHIYFSPDRRLVWWDEQLATQMGVCQASGVLRVGPQGMAILHYQLSLAVPNEVMDKVKPVIADWETAHP